MRPRLSPGLLLSNEYVMCDVWMVELRPSNHFNIYHYGVCANAFFKKIVTRYAKLSVPAHPIVSNTIPPMVNSIPTAFFKVTGSPPKKRPIRTPNRGAVKAMGITRPSGAPLIAA